MRKLLSYILVLAFALPLVAQEAESKDEVKKSDMREWKQRGDMKLFMPSHSHSMV